EWFNRAFNKVETIENAGVQSDSFKQLFNEWEEAAEIIGRWEPYSRVLGLPDRYSISEGETEYWPGGAAENSATPKSWLEHNQRARAFAATLASDIGGEGLIPETYRGWTDLAPKAQQLSEYLAQMDDAATIVELSESGYTGIREILNNGKRLAYSRENPYGLHYSINSDPLVDLMRLVRQWRGDINKSLLDHLIETDQAVRLKEQVSRRLGRSLDPANNPIDREILLREGTEQYNSGRTRVTRLFFGDRNLGIVTDPLGKVRELRESRAITSALGVKSLPPIEPTPLLEGLKPGELPLQVVVNVDFGKALFEGKEESFLYQHAYLFDLAQNADGERVWKVVKAVEQWVDPATGEVRVVRWKEVDPEGNVITYRLEIPKYWYLWYDGELHAAREVSKLYVEGEKDPILIYTLSGLEGDLLVYDVTGPQEKALFHRVYLDRKDPGGRALFEVKAGSEPGETEKLGAYLMAHQYGGEYTQRRETSQRWFMGLAAEKEMPAQVNAMALKLYRQASSDLGAVTPELTRQWVEQWGDPWRDLALKQTWNDTGENDERGLVVQKVTDYEISGAGAQFNVHLSSNDSLGRQWIEENRDPLAKDPNARFYSVYHYGGKAVVTPEKTEIDFSVVPQTPPALGIDSDNLETSVPGELRGQWRYTETTEKDDLTGRSIVSHKVAGETAVGGQGIRAEIYDAPEGGRVVIIHEFDPGKSQRKASHVYYVAGEIDIAAVKTQLEQILDGAISTEQAKRQKGWELAERWEEIQEGAWQDWHRVTDYSDPAKPAARYVKLEGTDIRGRVLFEVERGVEGGTYVIANIHNDGEGYRGGKRGVRSATYYTAQEIPSAAAIRWDQPLAGQAGLAAKENWAFIRSGEFKGWYKVTDLDERTEKYVRFFDDDTRGRVKLEAIASPEEGGYFVYEHEYRNGKLKRKESTLYFITEGAMSGVAWNRPLAGQPGVEAREKWIAQESGPFKDWYLVKNLEDGSEKYVKLWEKQGAGGEWLSDLRGRVKFELEKAPEGENGVYLRVHDYLGSNRRRETTQVYFISGAEINALAAQVENIQSLKQQAVLVETWSYQRSGRFSGWYLVRDEQEKTEKYAYIAKNDVRGRVKFEQHNAPEGETGWYLVENQFKNGLTRSSLSRIYYAADPRLVDVNALAAGTVKLADLDAANDSIKAVEEKTHLEGNRYRVTDLIEKISWEIELWDKDSRGRVKREIHQAPEGEVGEYTITHTYFMARVKRDISDVVHSIAGLVERWKAAGSQSDDYFVTQFEKAPATGEEYTLTFTAVLWHADIRGRVLQRKEQGVDGEYVTQITYYQGELRVRVSLTRHAVLGDVERRSHQSGDQYLVENLRDGNSAVVILWHADLRGRAIQLTEKGPDGDDTTYIAYHTARLRSSASVKNYQNQFTSEIRLDTGRNEQSLYKGKSYNHALYTVIDAPESSGKRVDGRPPLFAVKGILNQNDLEAFVNDSLVQPDQRISRTAFMTIVDTRGRESKNTAALNAAAQNGKELAGLAGSIDGLYTTYMEYHTASSKVQFSAVDFTKAGTETHRLLRSRQDLDNTVVPNAPPRYAERDYLQPLVYDPSRTVEDQLSAFAKAKEENPTDSQYAVLDQNVTLLVHDPRGRTDEVEKSSPARMEGVQGVSRTKIQHHDGRTRVKESNETKDGAAISRRRDTNADQPLAPAVYAEDDLIHQRQDAKLHQMIRGDTLGREFDLGQGAFDGQWHTKPVSFNGTLTQNYQLWFEDQHSFRDGTLIGESEGKIELRWDEAIGAWLAGYRARTALGTERETWFILGDERARRETETAEDGKSRLRTEILSYVDKTTIRNKVQVWVDILDENGKVIDSKLKEEWAFDSTEKVKLTINGKEQEVLLAKYKIVEYGIDGSPKPNHERFVHLAVEVLGRALRNIVTLEQLISGKSYLKQYDTAIGYINGTDVMDVSTLIEKAALKGDDLKITENTIQWSFAGGDWLYDNLPPQELSKPTTPISLTTPMLTYRVDTVDGGVKGNYVGLWKPGDTHEWVAMSMGLVFGNYDVRSAFGDGKALPMDQMHQGRIYNTHPWGETFLDEEYEVKPGDHQVSLQVPQQPNQKVPAVRITTSEQETGRIRQDYRTKEDPFGRLLAIDDKLLESYVWVSRDSVTGKEKKRTEYDARQTESKPVFDPTEANLKDDDILEVFELQAEGKPIQLTELLRDPRTPLTAQIQKRLALIAPETKIEDIQRSHRQIFDQLNQPGYKITRQQTTDLFNIYSEAGETLGNIESASAASPTALYTLHITDMKGAGGTLDYIFDPVTKMVIRRDLQIGPDTLATDEETHEAASRIREFLRQGSKPKQVRTSQPTTAQEEVSALELIEVPTLIPNDRQKEIKQFLDNLTTAEHRSRMPQNMVKALNAAKQKAQQDARGEIQEHDQKTADISDRSEGKNPQVVVGYNASGKLEITDRGTTRPFYRTINAQPSGTLIPGEASMAQIFSALLDEEDKNLAPNNGNPPLGYARKIKEELHMDSFATYDLPVGSEAAGLKRIFNHVASKYDLGIFVRFLPSDWNNSNLVHSEWLQFLQTWGREWYVKGIFLGNEVDLHLSPDEGGNQVFWESDKYAHIKEMTREELIRSMVNEAAQGRAALKGKEIEVPIYLGLGTFNETLAGLISSRLKELNAKNIGVALNHYGSDSNLRTGLDIARLHQIPLFVSEAGAPANPAKSQEQKTQIRVAQNMHQTLLSSDQGTAGIALFELSDEDWKGKDAPREKLFGVYTVDGRPKEFARKESDRSGYEGWFGILSHQNAMEGSAIQLPALENLPEGYWYIETALEMARLGTSPVTIQSEGRPLSGVEKRISLLQQAVNQLQILTEKVGDTNPHHGNWEASARQQMANISGSYLRLNLGDYRAANNKAEADKAARSVQDWERYWNRNWAYVILGQRAYYLTQFYEELSVLYQLQGIKKEADKYHNMAVEQAVSIVRNMSYQMNAPLSFKGLYLPMGAGQSWGVEDALKREYPEIYKEALKGAAKQVKKSGTDQEPQTKAQLPINDIDIQQPVDVKERLYQELYDPYQNILVASVGERSPPQDGILSPNEIENFVLKGLVYAAYGAVGDAGGAAKPGTTPTKLDIKTHALIDPNTLELKLSRYSRGTEPDYILLGNEQDGYFFTVVEGGIRVTYPVSSLETPFTIDEKKGPVIEAIKLSNNIGDVLQNMPTSSSNDGQEIKAIQEFLIRSKSNKLRVALIRDKNQFESPETKDKLLGSFRGQIANAENMLRGLPNRALPPKDYHYKEWISIYDAEVEIARIEGNDKDGYTFRIIPQTERLPAEVRIPFKEETIIKPVKGTRAMGGYAYTYYPDTRQMRELEYKATILTRADDDRIHRTEDGLMAALIEKVGGKGQKGQWITLVNRRGIEVARIDYFLNHFQWTWRYHQGDFEPEEGPKGIETLLEQAISGTDAEKEAAKKQLVSSYHKGFGREHTNLTYKVNIPDNKGGVLTSFEGMTRINLDSIERVLGNAALFERHLKSLRGMTWNKTNEGLWWLNGEETDELTGISRKSWYDARGNLREEKVGEAGADGKLTQGKKTVVSIEPARGIEQGRRLYRYDPDPERSAFNEGDNWQYEAKVTWVDEDHDGYYEMAYGENTDKAGLTEWTDIRGRWGEPLASIRYDEGEKGYHVILYLDHYENGDYKDAIQLFYGNSKPLRGIDEVKTSIKQAFEEYDQKQKVINPQAKNTVLPLDVLTQRINQLKVLQSSGKAPALNELGDLGAANLMAYHSVHDLTSVNNYFPNLPEGQWRQVVMMAFANNGGRLYHSDRWFDVQGNLYASVEHKVKSRDDKNPAEKYVYYLPEKSPVPFEKEIGVIVRKAEVGVELAQTDFTGRDFAYLYLDSSNEAAGISLSIIDEKKRSVTIEEDPAPGNLRFWIPGLKNPLFYPQIHEPTRMAAILTPRTLPTAGGKILIVAVDDLRRAGIDVQHITSATLHYDGQEKDILHLGKLSVVGSGDAKEKSRSRAFDFYRVRPGSNGEVITLTGDNEDRIGELEIDGQLSQVLYYRSEKVGNPYPVIVVLDPAGNPIYTIDGRDGHLVEINDVLEDVANSIRALYGYTYGFSSPRKELYDPRVLDESGFVVAYGTEDTAVFPSRGAGWTADVRNRIYANWINYTAKKIGLVPSDPFLGKHFSDPERFPTMSPMEMWTVLQSRPTVMARSANNALPYQEEETAPQTTEGKAAPEKETPLIDKAVQSFTLSPTQENNGLILTSPGAVSENWVDTVREAELAPLLLSQGKTEQAKAIVRFYSKVTDGGRWHLRNFYNAQSGQPEMYDPRNKAIVLSQERLEADVAGAMMAFQVAQKTGDSTALELAVNLLTRVFEYRTSPYDGGYAEGLPREPTQPILGIRAYPKQFPYYSTRTNAKVYLLLKETAPIVESLKAGLEERIAAIVKRNLEEDVPLLESLRKQQANLTKLAQTTSVALPQQEEWIKEHYLTLKQSTSSFIEQLIQKEIRWFNDNRQYLDRAPIGFLNQLSQSLAQYRQQLAGSALPGTLLALDGHQQLINHLIRERKETFQRLDPGQRAQLDEDDQRVASPELRKAQQKWQALAMQFELAGYLQQKGGVVQREGMIPVGLFDIYDVLNQETADERTTAPQMWGSVDGALWFIEMAHAMGGISNQELKQWLNHVARVYGVRVNGLGGLDWSPAFPREEGRVISPEAVAHFWRVAQKIGHKTAARWAEEKLEALLQKQPILSEVAGITPDQDHVRGIGIETGQGYLLLPKQDKSGWSESPSVTAALVYGKEGKNPYEFGETTKKLVYHESETEVLPAWLTSIPVLAVSAALVITLLIWVWDWVYGRIWRRHQREVAIRTQLTQPQDLLYTDDQASRAHRRFAAWVLGTVETDRTNAGVPGDDRTVQWNSLITALNRRWEVEEISGEIRQQLLPPQQQVPATTAPANRGRILLNYGDPESVFLFPLLNIYTLAYAWAETAFANDTQQRDEFLERLDLFARGISRYFAEEITRGTAGRSVAKYSLGNPGDIPDMQIWSELEIYLGEYADRLSRALSEDKKSSHLTSGQFQTALNELIGRVIRSDGSTDTYIGTDSDNHGNPHFVGNGIKEDIARMVEREEIRPLHPILGEYATLLPKIVIALLGIIFHQGTQSHTKPFLDFGAKYLAGAGTELSILFVVMAGALILYNIFSERFYMNRMQGRTGASRWTSVGIGIALLAIVGISLGTIQYPSLDVKMLEGVMALVVGGEALISIVFGRSLLGLMFYNHFKASIGDARPRTILLYFFHFAVYLGLAIWIGQVSYDWFFERSNDLWKLSWGGYNFIKMLRLMHYGVWVLATTVFRLIPTRGPGVLSQRDPDWRDPASDEAGRTAIVYAGGNSLASLVFRFNGAGAPAQATQMVMDNFNHLFNNNDPGAIAHLNALEIQARAQGISTNPVDWLNALHTAEATSDNNNGVTLFHLRQLDDNNLDPDLRINVTGNERASVILGWQFRRWVIEMMAPEAAGGNSNDTSINMVEMAEALGREGLGRHTTWVLISNQYNNYDNSANHPLYTNIGPTSEIGQREKLARLLEYVSNGGQHNVIGGSTGYVGHNTTAFGSKSASMNVVFSVPEILDIKSMVILDRNASTLHVDNFVTDIERMRSNPNLAIIVASRGTTDTLMPVGDHSRLVEEGHGSYMMSYNPIVGTGWGNIMAIPYGETLKRFADPQYPRAAWTASMRRHTGRLDRHFGLIGSVPNYPGISEDYWGVLHVANNMAGLGYIPEYALSNAFWHKLREKKSHTELMTAVPRWSGGRSNTLGDFRTQHINDWGPLSFFEREANRNDGRFYVSSISALLNIMSQPIMIKFDLTPFVGINMIFWVLGSFFNQILTFHGLIATIRSSGTSITSAIITGAVFAAAAAILSGAGGPPIPIPDAGMVSAAAGLFSPETIMGALNSISLAPVLAAGVAGFLIGLSWVGWGRWLERRIRDFVLFAPRLVIEALGQIAYYTGGVTFEFKASGGGGEFWNSHTLRWSFLTRAARTSSFPEEAAEAGSRVGRDFAQLATSPVKGAIGKTPDLLSEVRPIRVVLLLGALSFLLNLWTMSNLDLLNALMLSPALLFATGLLIGVFVTENRAGQSLFQTRGGGWLADAGLKFLGIAAGVANLGMISLGLGVGADLLPYGILMTLGLSVISMARIIAGNVTGRAE
ncbi:MAG: hypothetical protein HYS56_04530, partial [Candidatus Omnitrophica bacterium]|nr:hypothetical protein [Candidatus Omnitrophota bacterium]